MTTFQSIGPEYSRCYVYVNSNRHAPEAYNSRNMATFGQRVKKRREELEMSQDDLAKKAGLTQPTISNIESGRNKGSTFAVQLASALKCSPHWLTTGRGAKEVGANTEARAGYSSKGSAHLLDDGGKMGGGVRSLSARRRRGMGANHRQRRPECLRA
jgi:transcriptional regulator with XRE-family HTH domain